MEIPPVTRKRCCICHAYRSLSHLTKVPETRNKYVCSATYLHDIRNMIRFLAGLGIHVVLDHPIYSVKKNVRH
jgi:hypothetical protein